jgi:hypothetical protein
MNLRIAFLSLAAGLLPAAMAACGGNVVVDRTGKGGSATASSTSVYAAGGAIVTTTGPNAVTTTTGPVATVTTTTGPTTVTTTTTGAGGASCTAMSEVLINPSMGTPAMVSSIGANAPWNPNMGSSAIGYLLQGGPPPGLNDLHIVACQFPMVGSEGIQILASNVTGPGMFSKGAAVYIDAMGEPWSATVFQVNVSKLGPVGDTIEGWYFGMFQLNNATIGVKGNFVVCHVPDEEVP